MNYAPFKLRSTIPCLLANSVCKKDDDYKAKDRIKKMNISLADFDAHPEKVSKQIVLPNGQEVLLRPLRSDDASILGAYFLSLSQETRNLFAPHPFDRATAEIIDFIKQ